MSAQIQNLIGQAVGLLQNGSPSQAESILEKVLQIQKNNLPALEILGLIKGSQGNHSECAKYLTKAVKINPNNPATQYNLAKALSDSGEHHKAIPHHQKATQLAPDNPNTWLNFGMTLSLIDKDDEALAQYDKGLSLGSSPEGLFNKYISLKKLKRLDEAQKIIELLREKNPNQPKILLAYAQLLIEKESFTEAINTLKKLCDLTPTSKEAWLLRSECEYKFKLFKNAFESSQKLIEIDPNLAYPWSNAGAALTELKQYESAIKFLEKAISIDPNHAESWNNLGLCHLELKQYERALTCYKNTRKLDPALPFVLGSIIQIKLLIADWANIDSEIEKLIQDVANQKDMVSPFSFLSMCDEPSIQLINVKNWVKHTKPKQAPLPSISTKYLNKKIKLAYFSPDFKNHPVSQLLIELFELHDREQFEIHGFSLSKCAPDDTLRPRLKKAFDYFHEVENQSDHEIALLSRNNQIDIAIDLAGHTQGSRSSIFYHRAAPIQMTYLGYAGTTGIEEMDYLIADQVVIPTDSKKSFTEKIVYLPDCFLTDDSQRIASQKKYTKNDFGLPDQGFVFCCFNNSYKFNPKMVKAWSKILTEVKGSVFWVSENNVQFQENLIKEFGNNGIERRRIIFAKRLDTIADHLARLQLADLFLDTFPYNAHSTAIDCLKAGLPILSMHGKSFPSLVAKSLLINIATNKGEINLITSDEFEYIQTAILISTNQRISNNLKRFFQRNFFFNKSRSKSFCKNIELIYKRISIN